MSQQPSTLPWWHDVADLLGEAPPLTADQLQRAAIASTYARPALLERLPGTNLVIVSREALADYLAGDDWPMEDTDAIVGPLHIDAQQLDAWEESRARDFDVTDEIPY